MRKPSSKIHQNAGSTTWAKARKIDDSLHWSFSTFSSLSSFC
jgi:hypothetical protein